MSKKRLVALSGSLRKGSYNTALLHNATDLLGDRAEVRILDIRMPLYDPDLEDAEFAASLAATKAAITDADGRFTVTCYSQATQLVGAVRRTPDGLAFGRAWSVHPGAREVRIVLTR